MSAAGRGIARSQGGGLDELKIPSRAIKRGTNLKETQEGAFVGALFVQLFVR